MMLPLPIILAIVLAGMVIGIIFLLFRFSEEEKDETETHSLRIDELQSEIGQKQTEIEETAVAKDKFQQEAVESKEESNKLKNELAEKDKRYQELNAKFEKLKAEGGGKKDLEIQLEQQKRQFTEQVIKCKKLEKDLHTRQDEVAAIDKENQRLKQENERLEKELKQEKSRPAEAAEKPAEPEQKPAEPEQKPSAPAEKAPEPPAPPPEPGPKPAAEKPAAPGKKQSPFNRFLKPKTGQDQGPDT